MFIHIHILELGAYELNIWHRTLPFGTMYTKTFCSDFYFHVFIYFVSYVVVFLFL